MERMRRRITRSVPVAISVGHALLELPNCRLQGLDGGLGEGLLPLGSFQYLRVVGDHEAVEGLLESSGLLDRHVVQEAVDCGIEDDEDRPAILYGEMEGSNGLFDITGNIKVSNPHGAQMKLGDKQHHVDLIANPVR